jgi:hypothetical protein
MKRSGVVHLAGALIAALYLLASSPVAAQYTIVPLSGDESGIQVGGIAKSSTASLTKAAVTADLSACKGSLGSFEIKGFNGPPNTTQIFKVTQTASGILGFSNTSSGLFTDNLDIDVPLDAKGNGVSNPFYLKGVDLGQTIVSICNDQLGCVWNQVSSIVVRVNSVEWEVIASPLDANPNAGGGLRIFPEKTTPTDTTDRTTVMVKVTLSAEYSKPVYLKVFDVDDPSSNNLVLDKDGPGGIDNKGTTPNLSSIDGTSTADLTTGSDGVVRIIFHVSKQPGDNFRATGTCLMPDRDGLTVNGVGVKDASGQPLPTDVAKITPLLTIWRRLHIEVDSMGPVQGNFVEGTITRAHSTNKGTTVLTLLDPLEDYRRFETGRITIEDVGAFPIERSRAGTVTVQGVIAQDPAGKHFTLVDDDDFNDNDDEPDGDEGEDLTAPDRSWVQESDDRAANVFAPAYIKPTYDLNDQNLQPKVPFARNADITDFWDYFDNRRYVGNKNYWVAYLLGAYQYLTSNDGDPDGEVVQWGSGSLSWGAAVFLETGRPLETTRYADKASFVNQAATTAHELGHWFQQDDDNDKADPEGGLMCWPPDRKKGSFSDKTLSLIRDKFKDLP